MNVYIIVFLIVIPMVIIVWILNIKKTAIKNLKDKNKVQRAAEILYKLRWKPTDDEYGAIYYIQMKNFTKCVTIGKQAVKPLIDTMKNDDPWVREAVVTTLGSIGGPQAIKALIRALNDKDWKVRKSAAKSLLNLNWEPTSDENGARYYVAIEKFDLCIQIGEPAVEVLIDVITSKKYSGSYLCERAIETIGNIGNKRGAIFLTKLLKDDDPNIRKIAADALGKIGEDLAVEPLLAALNDENNDVNVRLSTIEALGKIGSIKAVEPLIKILTTEKSSWIRGAVVEALGEIGLIKAIKPLINVMKDDKLVIKASEALVKIGRPAVRYLINMLNDDNEYVREYAAKALGEIGDGIAIEPLTKAIDDKNQVVSHQALNSLRKIRGKK